MSKSRPLRRYPIPTRKHPPHRLIPVSARRRHWYRIPKVIGSLAFLSLVLFASYILPESADCDPLRIDLDARLQAPSAHHWLGTDKFGRDVGCRVLNGGRISLPVGVLATITAVLPGLWLGMLAGYYDGWVDALIGRLADVMLAFPNILLAMLIIAWLGPGLSNTTLAIGLAGIPNYVRLSRSSTIQIKKSWFVRAARIIGCTDTRILIRHIFPNVLPSIAALATIDIAWAILNAATLSFLGLSTQPPTPEWGAMINEGRELLRLAPWISLAPSAMMTLTILAINLLGDGLRDALDPQSRW